MDDCCCGVLVDGMGWMAMGEPGLVVCIAAGRGEGRIWRRWALVGILSCLLRL